MPVYSIKEIADKCGMPPKNIHTYISRGKIIKRKDSLIDTSNTINEDFLKKHIKEQSKEGEPTVKQKKTINQPKQIDNNDDNNLDNYISSNKLNKLKAEKTKWEIEILKLKSKIQSGELIPLAVAENIAGIHFNSITSIFRNAVDNEISDLCNDLGVSREKLTKIRGKIKDIVNKSVISSKQKTKEDLRNFSKTYEDDEEVIEDN